MAQVARSRPLRSSPRRGFLYLFVYLALLPCLAFLALAAAVAGYEFRHARHVYPGISLTVATANGPLVIDLGGLTRDEAVERLQYILTPYPGPDTILRDGDQTWAFSADDLGIELDASATVDAAYAEGRGNTRLACLLRQYELYRYGDTVLPVLRYNEGQEAYVLNRVAREINRPASEGVLRLDGLKVLATAGETGREMDVAASRIALHNHLIRGGEAEVALVVRDVHPVLGKVDDAAAQVAQLIKSPLTLAFRDGQDQVQAAIKPEVLAQWLTLRQEVGPDGKARLVSGVDGDQVRAYVATELAAKMTREPRDGTFSFNAETKVLTPVTPSRNGW